MTSAESLVGAAASVWQRQADRELSRHQKISTAVISRYACITLYSLLVIWIIWIKNLKFELKKTIRSMIYISITMENHDHEPSWQQQKIRL